MDAVEMFLDEIIEQLSARFWLIFPSFRIILNVEVALLCVWDGIVNGLNHVEEKKCVELVVYSLISNVREGFVASNKKKLLLRGRIVEVSNCNLILRRLSCIVI